MVSIFLDGCCSLGGSELPSIFFELLQAFLDRDE
jgi:hypothetical protein